jgi:tRNA A-37 threonylcarbamoyl transferase component Bud32
MKFGDDDPDRDPEEVPLPGGRLTRGVVRVGETVRRPRKACSAFVARLLMLLEERGFSAAPRHLGVDERERDILSFIAGVVPAKWRRFEDAQVETAARLLRAFHDVTRDSPLVRSGEVVCHFDCGPSNFVFQDERPVALIDFDMAAPGDALEDVGYLAWAWCVSGKPTREPVELQAMQVRVVADAYGLVIEQRARLVDAMIERQRQNGLFWARQLSAAFTGPDTPPEALAERVAWSEREQHFTRANAAVFRAALG